MSHATNDVRGSATRDDIVRLLGDIGDGAVVEVLELKPTLQEIEEAAAWLDAREPSMPRQRHPQTLRVAQIVEIADRDDEEPEFLR